MSRPKRPLVLHPLLFSLFLVLFFYARNMSELPLKQVLVPAATAVALAGAVLLLLGVILRDFGKAGLVVSVTVLLFFSYKHLLRLLEILGFPSGRTRYGAHVVLIPVVLAFFVFIMYLIYRAPRKPVALTSIANLMAVTLVALSLCEVGVYEFRRHKPWATRPGPADSERPAVALTEPDVLPNIYYIIPDTYPRADILEEVYGYDNSEFVRQLEERGFYVASKSRANYSQTTLSVASSLNMEYLDGLVSRIGDRGDDREPLKEVIVNSRVRRFLERYDYKFISFKTGYHPVTIEDSDIFLSRDSRSEFTAGLLSTMPLGASSSSWDSQRAVRLFTFEALARLPEAPSPHLVFAHILCPHPPFIFGPNGEELTPRNEYCNHDGSAAIRKEGITRKEYMDGYTGQLCFLSGKMLQVIDAILAAEKSPPIIVIQGDTGPGAFLDCFCSETTYFKERLSILNAYYLPDGGSELLYETITPVNTFRVILNRYFGAGLELLEDRSYFACWDTPYKFVDATDIIGTPIDLRRYARLKDEDYFPPLEAEIVEVEGTGAAGGVGEGLDAATAPGGAAAATGKAPI